MAKAIEGGSKAQAERKVKEKKKKKINKRLEP